MKTILLSLLISIILSCQLSNDTSPVLEANAIVYNNNLPVDGCAEHISLIDAKGDEIKSVLPTEATKAKFFELLNAEIVKIPKDTYSGNLHFAVVLKYRETQQNAELLCGWNKKSMLQQIEIISISKK